MRPRLGTAIAVMLLGGAILAGSPAGARSFPHVTARAESGVPPTHLSKLPWNTGYVGVVPHRIVVVWKAGASGAARRALVARMGTPRVAPTPRLDVDVVRVPGGRSVQATMRRLQRSPLVRFAEPDRIASLAGTPPDDTFFDPDQWGLANTGLDHDLSAYPPDFAYGVQDNGTAGADVQAIDAWDSPQMGDPSTVIAVVDTGVDTTHPDLTGQLVPGHDFVDGGDPMPGPGLDNAHGTHVAGIIAAVQNNTEGISGICPGCRVMPIRVGSASGITLGNELKGIDFAIANGADVINLSLGSPLWSKAERAEINKAGKNGILVVVAAGNSSEDNDIQFYPSDQQGDLLGFAPSYPASYTLKNILSVAASNDRDQYGYLSQCRTSGDPLWTCGFTSWGHDSVDVAAPGVDIVSTVTQGVGEGIDPDYDVWDGTSMATPMVAGIAGLVWSEHPGYSAVAVKNAIMRSTEHPATLQVFDAWAGKVGLPKKALSGHFTRTQGRVNAFKALTASTANATPVTDGNIDHARGIKTERTGRVTWPGDANDVFRKRLTKGTKYHVVLNGPKGKDFDLWVWRPGTKEIFQFTAGCFVNGGSCPALMAVSGGKTADEALTFKAPKTGVFYLQVNGWYSGGSYTLTIKKV